ncbi:MAG: methyltransferase, partial [Bacteroidota bacterium]
MIATISTFLELLTAAVKKNELVKLTLGGKRNKEDDLKNVYVKPVILKTGNKLSIVYRHNTKD